MSERTCDWCGAPNPRWVLWVGESVVDRLWQQAHGFPGPGSRPVFACEEHRADMDRSYPPERRAP